MDPGLSEMEPLSGATMENQTITVNLDEAAQFLLQHQAIAMGDGSYQLFEQPVIQVEREDGTLEAQTLSMEVLQALSGELVQQLQTAETSTLHAPYSLVNEQMELPVSESGLLPNPGGDGELVAHAGVMVASQGDGSVVSPDESMAAESSVVSLGAKENVGSGTGTVLSPVKEEFTRMDGAEKMDGENLNREASEAQESAHVPDGLEEPLKLECQEGEEREELERTAEVEMEGESSQHADNRMVVNDSGAGGVGVSAGQPSVKEQLDLTNPIPLSDQSIITVNGKKCYLSYDPETQQVCAYPIKTTGAKKRGRPKMSEAEKVAAKQRKLKQLMEAGERSVTPVTPEPSEQSSAAHTLLELSNIGSDGVRRSGRPHKKAKVLKEYEELSDSDDDKDLAFEDNPEKDPDIKLEPGERKRSKVAPPLLNDLVPTPTGLRTTGGKRGRGRPKRYNLPPSNPPRSIPAMMLPSADGQTLVMAPIQDFGNLQQLRGQLPQLVPKTVLTRGEGSTEGQGSTLSLVSHDDTLPLETSGVLDSSSMIPPALQGDSLGEHSAEHVDGLDTSPSSLLNLMAGATEPDKVKSEGSQGSAEVFDSQQVQPPVTQQATVIQIPDNLLASFGFKKDPIKIGLKASESELEKLKCPKCDFQGYYTQQYRAHIATHGEHVHKCKCCSFLSLDEAELLQHFKENHPRCICTECGFMAEHAYMIKRHMMRHDTKSCTCHVCGKVYKDLYILKMHIKMVHMPAEVLFECDVCSKKFTRKAHLKRHMRIHEPEKPFKCTLCDYRGCERSDISKHMLIHQEPKHACERCGKTFRHIKNKELHMKRHYGQRDYKCGVCDFYGYTFTDIRKHIERKHQDIKSLICDKCGRHFRNELALKEHSATCTVVVLEQVNLEQHFVGQPHPAMITAIGPGQAVPGGVATATQGVSFMVTAGGEQHIQLVDTSGLQGDELEEEEEDDLERVAQEVVATPESTVQTVHLIGQDGMEMLAPHSVAQAYLGGAVASAEMQEITLADSSAEQRREIVITQNVEYNLEEPLVGPKEEINLDQQGEINLDQQGEYTQEDSSAAQREEITVDQQGEVILGNCGAEQGETVATGVTNYQTDGMLDQPGGPDTQVTEREGADVYK